MGSFYFQKWVSTHILTFFFFSGKEVSFMLSMFNLFLIIWILLNPNFDYNLYCFKCFSLFSGISKLSSLQKPLLYIVFLNDYDYDYYITSPLRKLLRFFYPNSIHEIEYHRYPLCLLLYYMHLNAFYSKRIRLFSFPLLLHKLILPLVADTVPAKNTLWLP